MSPRTSSCFIWRLLTFHVPGWYSPPLLAKMEDDASCGFPSVSNELDRLRRSNSSSRFDLLFSSSTRRGEYTSSTSLKIMFMCLSNAISVPVRVPRIMFTYRITILTRLRCSFIRKSREWGPESRWDAIVSNGCEFACDRFFVSCWLLLLEEVSCVANTFPRCLEPINFWVCIRCWFSRCNGSSFGRSVAHFPRLSSMEEPFIHGFARATS